MIEQDQPSEPLTSPEKRQYKAPRVEETGDFERLVLSCSHRTGVACPDGNPQS